MDHTEAQKETQTEAATAKWPPFSMLKGYLIPEWIGHSVDEIAEALQGKLHSVWFDVSASYYYDDNDNYDLKGHVGLRYHSSQKVSEDDLDQIPAMRRMERRAKKLWDVLPVDVSEEGGINGEVHYSFAANGFEFTWNGFDYCEDYGFYATAEYEAGEWKYQEQIKFYTEKVSETALAIGGAKRILEGIDPNEFNLEKWPENDDMIIEQDDEGMITLTVPGGGLFVHYQSKVA